MMIDFLIDNTKWLSELVKKHERDSTGLHDWIFYLKNDKKCIVELQKTSYGDTRSGYCRYGDIRLDLISSFTNINEKAKERFHDWGWRWKALNGQKDLNFFSNNCRINKWGKLVTCDAHILVFMVMDRKKKIHVIKIYNNKELQNNKRYFIENYPIKINHKIGEVWGSAFIPVSEKDKI